MFPFTQRMDSQVIVVRPSHVYTVLGFIYTHYSWNRWENIFQLCTAPTSNNGNIYVLSTHKTSLSTIKLQHFYSCLSSYKVRGIQYLYFSTSVQNSKWIHSAWPSVPHMYYMFIGFNVYYMCGTRLK